MESKFKTLGEKAYSCLEKAQELGLYATLLGNYPRLGIKVNCYLVNSQTFKTTCWGNWGKQNGSRWRLIFGDLTRLRKKVSSLLRVCSSKFLLR